MPTSIDTLYQAALDRAVALRRLPVSTYRLQFHAGFTFADATTILPYLASLGITHVYASPYLAAAAGSTHGYDVIDHCRLNPELGTGKDYDAFLAALKASGLKHILDTVPNHVGVATNDNTWWNDVLEHGPASRFAGYFDITWRSSARPELHNKVLLPTLGKPYGQALDDGEIQLSFEADTGRLWVNYFARRFPLSPQTYDRVLCENIDALGDGGRDLRSVVCAATHLPFHWQTDAASVEERHREGESIKTRLAALADIDPAVRSHVDAAVKAINGTPGDPASFDRLDQLLDRQCFRLAEWHVAFDEINYRRFFDVNDLAALSMEKPEVFEATHSLILPKLATGDIAGLRIDHPDGLFDPAGYLLRLQHHYVVAIAETIYDGDDWPGVRRGLLERLESARGTGFQPVSSAASKTRIETPCHADWPLPVWAEKILAMDEPLIAEWAVHGTSGYDDLVMLNGLFVDPAAEPKFDALWQNITGDATSYADLAYANKKRMLESSLASELHTLTHRLDTLAQRHRRSVDFTFRTLQAAVRETVACFGVYRTYVSGESITDVDRRHITTAIEKAKAKNPRVLPAVFDYLRDTLLLNYAPHADAAEKADQQAFAGKFQQLTSPVTAKGIEDTTFYQFNRYLTLNEVGGEPAIFGVPPERLHRFFADRQRDWPYAISTLSTHDTKRSEDVRARLNVLADMPDEWAACVKEWFETNAPLRQQAPGGVSPSPGEEYLIYQTLLGAWPLGDADEKDFADRIQAYVLKAIREAKLRTRWGEPDDAHEAAVKSFIDGLLDRARSKKFYASFLPLLKKASHFGLLNSLSQTLLKLTSPGVPDTYQGTELWDFSLVDPDNRRPVDYAIRQKMLTTIDAASPADLLADMADGRVKLRLTAAVLRFRRDHADLFARGDYTPLAATGAHAKHVFGFTRTLGGRSVTIAVPLRTAAWSGPAGLPIGDVWGDTTLTLPATGGGRHLLTGEAVNSLRAADAFVKWPVAIWVHGC